MTDLPPPRRQNQKHRTRKDLLQATLRLLKQGRKPTLEDVAEEALVSRATAYRYFPSIEALLIEAPLDVMIPDAEAILGTDTSADPVARVQKVDTALHDVTLANAAAMRMLAIHSLGRSLNGGGDGETPPRQNRRTPLIEAALAPARKRLDPAQLDTLINALSIIIGIEGIFTCQDVLQLDDARARAVKGWMIEALIAAAQKPR